MFDRLGFRPEELLSPDGLHLLERNVFPLRISAVTKLAELRDKVDGLMVNIPGHLHRGWRSPEENKEIYYNHRIRNGGEGESIRDNRFSFHIAGVAFDISIPEMEVEKISAIAKELGWVGIGLYNSFVHVDLRDGSKAFWDNRTKT